MVFLPSPLIAPATQDFLQKTLGSSLSAGATTVALNNTTGVQNLIGVAIIDRVDSNGTETPTKREVVKFTGTSGSNLTTCTRGLAGTTDQDHATGAVVEFGPDIVWAQSIYDNLSEVLTPATGAINTTNVVTPTGTQTLTNKTLTAPVISTITNTGTVTLFTASDTVVGKATTDTLTNKRITKRVGTTASSATPTPDSDSHDVYTVTALAEAATFGEPTGTPTNGQSLIIRIKDNATARTLAFNAVYRFSTDIPAPTTTVLSKTMYLGFIYNSADSKWDCVAYVDNF